MNSLRPWQKDFLHLLPLQRDATINLYGKGGEGKTFIANMNKDTNTKYVHYNGFIPKRDPGISRLVVISTNRIQGLKKSYNASDPFPRPSQWTGTGWSYLRL